MRADDVERLHPVEGDDDDMSLGSHVAIVDHPDCGVNDMIPTLSDMSSAIVVRRSQLVGAGPSGCCGTWTRTLWALPIERITVDVRIGVTQAHREINVEVADDTDRAALHTQVEAALSGAVDVFWLTDKKGREIGVAASKIAYVELGASDGERRIGFGG